MFFSVITENLKPETSTKNLVTFKNGMGLRMKEKMGLLTPKIPITRLTKVWNCKLRKQCRDSNIFELCSVIKIFNKSNCSGHPEHVKDTE